MIGDDFELDILGAHGAGIRSVLFRTQHRSPATASATNMDEALDAVLAVLHTAAFVIFLKNVAHTVRPP